MIVPKHNQGRKNGYQIEFEATIAEPKSNFATTSLRTEIAQIARFRAKSESTRDCESHRTQQYQDEQYEQAEEETPPQ